MRRHKTNTNTPKAKHAAAPPATAMATICPVVSLAGWCDTGVTAATLDVLCAAGRIMDVEGLESVELAEEDTNEDIEDVDDEEKPGLVAGSVGVPVAKTIPETLLKDFEGTRVLDGSVDDVKVAVVVHAVTDRGFVDVTVTVIVPIVSGIALGIPEQISNTLLSSTEYFVGQFEIRHSSAASPIVNPDVVVWVHRHVRSRSFRQLEVS